MLEEIFDNLANELREASKPISKRIKIQFGNNSALKDSSVRIALLQFNTDLSSKNFPTPPPVSSACGFSFYIIAYHTDYLKQLALTEAICNAFEEKPFLQWTFEGREYEMAISSMDLTLDVLNQFWIAQAQPHQPVLFYKARVSDI